VHFAQIIGIELTVRYSLRSPLVERDEAKGEETRGVAAANAAA